MQTIKMFNSITRLCMICICHFQNYKYLFALLFGFAMVHSSQGQVVDPDRTDTNYYVYEESTPVLNDIGEIADYYNTSIEYILGVKRNYSNDFEKRQYLFEDTLSNLEDNFSEKNDWIFESDYPSASTFLRKMLKYQYAHLFPLEKGDTLWLPLGSVQPIDRTTHFEAFDKLFEEKKTEMITDSLVGNYISYYDSSGLDTSGRVPYKLWECVADTIQEDPFIGGFAAFKFVFSPDITAYLVKVDYYKPYSCYLYLFRNNDKKLIGEEPILVYFSDEKSPCRYRTDTKIVDYNQDGYLDLIIYQKEDCFGEHTSSDYTFRLLLWDKERNIFVTEYESIDTYQSKGFIGNISEIRKGFNEVDY